MDQKLRNIKYAKKLSPALIIKLGLVMELF